MINRTYIVKMPESVSTTPLDILVQASPGSNAAPVTAGGDGKYYEWRGRTLRFEQLKLTSAGAANASWAPRARLGIWLSVAPFGNAAIVTDLPDLQLSASFGVFSATGIAIPAVADNTTSGPLIRLTGGAATAAKFFLVNLMIAEDKDEDRSPSGRS